jgi:hypothetical protein
MKESELDLNRGVREGFQEALQSEAPVPRSSKKFMQLVQVEERT